MAPPAKRRKRNVLPSSSPSSASDGADEVTLGRKEAQSVNRISSSPTPASGIKPAGSGEASSQMRATQTKLQPRGKTANQPENGDPLYPPKNPRGINGKTKSASTSPEKPKRRGKSDDKVKSGNIFTFFTKQAQRQQAGGAGTGTTTARLNTMSKDSKAEDYDIISDDDLLEDTVKTSSVVGLAARKRTRGSQPLKNSDVEAPSLSQRFLSKPKLPPAAKTEEDLRPWAERFAPVNLDELAVHKKKVSDVRGWLDNVIDGRMRQRLLLLKGPAGTGKTTTVQLLAKDMGCEVLEWRNPVGSVATAEGFQSMAAQFEEFLGRGGKFGQLDIFSSDDRELSRPEPKPLDRRKRIILVEEFPNTFTRSSTALQSFRGAIVQYLSSNTPPLSMFHQNHSLKDPITPVVMIISETLLTTTSASADSFTAHRLLGPEILQHPGVGAIEFNPIAPTLLAKALDILVQKESRKSGRRKTPGPLVLKKLGEIGDIRSAIGSLEFLCLRGDRDGDWGAKIAFGKAKKSSKDVTLTRMEEESLEMVTRREASLGIFHAVGKVVYNKRDERPPQLPADADVEQLPGYISTYARPRRSQISVNELIDETGTDTQTFIAALHENYILSCEAPPSSFEFSSLDHVNGCIDALSESDLLCPSWDGSLNSSGFGGGTGGRGTGGDILRQDEIAFQVAIRGILFSLPYPVKRKAPAAGGLRTGKGGDAFKMFYPTSLKLWRMKEEIESTIDHYVTRLMKGDDEHLSGITAGAAAFARPKTGTVESWKNSRVSHVSSPTKVKKDTEPPPAPLLSLGTSARKEMLLERLPYMLLIKRAKKSPASARAIKDIEKVATFHGIGGPSEDAPDEADDNAVAGEEWATDKPVEGSSPRKKELVIRGRGMATGLPLSQPQEQKFVLSDDDIEDD
ncbi:p-loop containing nucleoside triphosphate hydrolase [Venustampulla echinocandica]|uniref:p-loop containing nucleoside triphosphate hydrolase n=1 Tax=Venustampulla echinocandica TaxID=2656787 RepID=A0A370TSL4_9HELO|nr:p-loop containing nucleoside triphosphate hydrolase [Venustampulla echinocandica]RDL38478.1 p-loop containing nucleoside triphosphate hydrolase [Venustampulla echinocandica]